LNPSCWKELKLDPTVIKGVVAEEWEERIHTLGSTFMGLTVACARCHDHKFDPIGMQDYYALAGVLPASVKRTSVSYRLTSINRSERLAHVCKSSNNK
jgi:cytochrome c553